MTADAERSERASLALELLGAALEAVEADRCTGEALDGLRAAGHELDGCFVFAFGKAARGMAEAAARACAPRGGIVLGLDEGPLGPLVMRRAGHPVPVDDASTHGREVLALARSLDAGDTALCLISGGGSAMLELPVAGVSLADLRVTTTLLLRAGASIDETNAVRRRLSQLKGGRLAVALAPARIVNVLISDVPGGDPSVVASGPTLRDVAGIDPAAVVQRRGLEARLPASVRAALARTPDEPAPELFERVHTVVAADNAAAQRAVVRAGERRGLHIVRHDEARYVAGEAREAGRVFARAARARCAGEALDGVVWGGETTVHVTGDGRGGRNHELVLGALGALDGGLVASLGTDGIDGSSDAAGAYADASVVVRARELGLEPGEHLRRNDAGPFFARAGGRIETGPTGTNVADVCLYLP